MIRTVFLLDRFVPIDSQKLHPLNFLVIDACFLRRGEVYILKAWLDLINFGQVVVCFLHRPLLASRRGTASLLLSNR